LKYLC